MKVFPPRLIRSIGLLSLIALAAAGCIKQGVDDSANVPEHIQQAPPPASEVIPPPPAGVPPPQMEDPGNGSGEIPNYFSYKGVDGKTALELLRAGHHITTKTFSGIGEFVESIDGVKPDSKHFWAFYVNGKSSNVGASSYVTKSGDTLEWKLEQIK